MDQAQLENGLWTRLGVAGRADLSPVSYTARQKAIQNQNSMPALFEIKYVLCAHTGCEFSTGLGTNASGIKVGPVQKLVYFYLN